MNRSKNKKKSIVEKEVGVDSNLDSSNENSDPEGLAWPSVVCVMVANDPGEWFDSSVKSIIDSEYPDLTTLILDLSENEDLKERVAGIAPSAFIRKFDKTYNFASAINDAVNSIEGATYVLICHDDVVLDKEAISSMVQEAFRSNASMVGPKILDGENPDCLLEVGGMIDRFGVPYTGIEHDEVDQSQHDGVRDVFYVSSAAMLVRADLFRALGGFDELCFPGAEDIDLSWRAHLVGARVLVQPDATVQHHHVSESVDSKRVSAKAIVAQHRMRAVLKNSSKVSLAWIIPLSFILHSIEGIFFLLRLDPKRSVILFKGWLWNIKHSKQLKKTRKEIQSSRVVSDRDISSHQIAGSARIRRFFNSISRSRQLKQYRTASIESTKKTKKSQSKFGPIYFGAFLLYLLSLRNLVLGRVESVGSFVKWQPFSDQLDALLHGGYPTTGSPNFSSTAQRLISVMLTPLFLFNEGLAQRIFILSLIPIAVYGVQHVLKSFDISARSVVIGSLTYGTAIMGYGIFENGKFFALVTAAAIPYFIDGLLRNRSRKVGISAACIIAFNPASAIVLFILAGVYLLVGKSSISFAKTFRAMFYGVLIALAVNIGVVYDAINRIDRSNFGLTNISLSLKDYFFSSNYSNIIIAITAGVCMVALLISKGIKVATLKVLALSTTLLIVAAMFIVVNAQPVFDFANIFIIGAFAFALSAAFCVNAFTSELTKKSLGIFHFMNIIGVFAIAGIMFIQLPIVVDGSLNMPSNNWGNQIESKFDSRIAYIGSPNDLGANPSMLPGGRAVVLSNKSELTTAVSLVGPSSKLDDDFRKVYRVIINNETTHAGYLLAKMGIETIAVPTAISPESEISETDNELLKAFDRQIDLIRLQDRSGLVVYKNQVFDKDFKNNQISPTINIDKLLSSRGEEINDKAKYSQIDLVNYLIVFGSGIILFIVLVWPRRKELIANAYSSVKRIQSIKNESESDVDSKKKIQQTITIDLNEDDLIIDKNIEKSESVSK